MFSMAFLVFKVVILGYVPLRMDGSTCMEIWYNLEDKMLSTVFFFSFITEKLLVVLRDGRTLIGILRSIDQFGKFKLTSLLKDCLYCCYFQYLYTLLNSLQ